MFDLRSAKELKNIRALCEAHSVDPERMLADPKCDLLECGRRLNAIKTARAMMGLNIYTGTKKN